MDAEAAKKIKRRNDDWLNSQATAKIIAHCDKCGRAYVSEPGPDAVCLVHKCGGIVRLDEPTESKT